MTAFDQHTRELRRLLAFGGSLGVLAGTSYFMPGTEEIRPWMAGEPIPLIHLALDNNEVVETAPGVLVSRSLDAGEASDAERYALTDDGDFSDADIDALASLDLAAPAPAEHAPAPSGDATPSDAPDAPTIEVASTDAPDAASPTETTSAEEPTALAAVAAPAVTVTTAGLVDRAPARGTPLEIPEGAFDRYFASLARAEAGEDGHITRALHFGDSTIASDGITRTVRRRLQNAYGDGGPGFLPVQVDRRWAMRPGVLRNAEGDWKTLTITFGGAELGYYGLAGTVSTASGPSTSVLGGRKIDGKRQSLATFDVYYQVQPDGGTLDLTTDGGDHHSLKTAADAHHDVFRRIDATDTRTLTVKTGDDGPVTLYGVAMETTGPGITWETLGVAGAGSGSHFRQGPNHISRQVRRRNPDLIVWQLGGNEVGLPVLKSGDGTKYKERYKKAVRKVLAGAPSASCLMVTPLDQAERYRGQVRSKPNLDRMISLQRAAAFELGCAFWDARAAMGGEGAFERWLSADPPLAWSDLEHLTGRGLSLIGHGLADAIEVAYREWKQQNPALIPDTPALAQADSG